MFSQPTDGKVSRTLSDRAQSLSQSPSPLPTQLHRKPIIALLSPKLPTFSRAFFVNTMQEENDDKNRNTNNSDQTIIDMTDMTDNQTPFISHQPQSISSTTTTTFVETTTTTTTATSTPPHLKHNPPSNDSSPDSTIHQSLVIGVAITAVSFVTRVKRQVWNDQKKAIKTSPPALCQRCATTLIAGVNNAILCSLCLEQKSICAICNPTEENLDNAYLCKICLDCRPNPQSLSGPKFPYRRKKNVLAIEGGGLRGIYTLILLKKIEQMANRRICDMFDLIVGCSAGGIIALGLGSLDLQVDEGIKLFRTLSKDAWVVAAGSGAQKATTAIKRTTGVALKQTTIHKYKHEPLEMHLKRYLTHDRPMRSTCMNKPKVAVVAVQWNMTPKRPVLFRSYDRPNDKTSLANVDAKIWEAARATSAAPTFFRPFQLGDDWFVDGGLVAQDPSLAALSEATALYGNTNDINVFLTVGSGKKQPTQCDVNPNPWLWSLANDIVGTCIHHDMNAVAMQSVLKDRFVKINGEIHQTTMDNRDLMDEWIENAKRFCDAPENEQMFQQLVSNLTTPC